MIEPIKSELSLDTNQQSDRLATAPRGAPVKANQFQIYNITLNASIQTFMANLEPDWWHVVFPIVNNADIRVYLEPAASGEFLRLGQGGSLKIPARGIYLTVQNLGAVVALGTVIANTGFDGATFAIA